MNGYVIAFMASVCFVCLASGAYYIVYEVRDWKKK